jgi:hypothetical protein
MADRSRNHVPGTKFGPTSVHQRALAPTNDLPTRLLATFCFASKLHGVWLCMMYYARSHTWGLQQLLYGLARPPSTKALVQVVGGHQRLPAPTNGHQRVAVGIVRLPLYTSWALSAQAAGLNITRGACWPAHSDMSKSHMPGCSLCVLALAFHPQTCGLVLSVSQHREALQQPVNVLHDTSTPSCGSHHTGTETSC